MIDVTTHSERPVIIGALVPPHGWLPTIGTPPFRQHVLRRMRRYGATKVALEHLGARLIRDTTP